MIYKHSQDYEIGNFRIILHKMKVTGKYKGSYANHGTNVFKIKWSKDLQGLYVP